MRIVAFAGVSGSGKSTAAGFLVSILNAQGHSVKMDAFGLPLKKRYREISGIDRLAWLEKDDTCRRWMQGHGQSMREYSAHYWIGHLAGRNNMDWDVWGGSAGDKPAEFLVIDDVRYRNEAEFCSKHGVVWMVDGDHRPLAGEAAGHESEANFAEVAKYACVVVDNRADNLALLRKTLEGLVREGQHLKREVGHA